MESLSITGVLQSNETQSAVNGAAPEESPLPQSQLTDEPTSLEREDYWNVVYDPDIQPDQYAGESTDYDIDIYWVDRPAVLLNRNKRLKRIRRRLFADYERELELRSSEIGPNEKFPKFLADEKWGLIRSYIPARDGSSYITELPTEVLETVFHKMFYLLVFDHYRKPGMAKVACVNRAFNSLLQPILFKSIAIDNVELLKELASLIAACPHIGPLIKVLKLKFSSASENEAREISLLLSRIVQESPNLKTISVMMSSGREGHDLVIPCLNRELLGGYTCNVVNLNFIFANYTMPFTKFAQGFQNLKVLQIGHVDMSRLAVNKNDLRIRLSSVEYLQLTSPTLGQSAVQLLAAALPRIKSVDATAVSGGIVDLLCAIADRTDTLENVKLTRCAGQGMKNSFTDKLWMTLRSVEMTGCSMLSARILPTYEGCKIHCLPKLKKLRITADIKLPMSNERFDELIEAVNRLPGVVGQQTAPLEPTGATAGSRRTGTAAPGVDIAIVWDNCAFGDSFGSAVSMSLAQRYVTLPNYMHYTILETVGPVDEPRTVKRMDVQTAEKFCLDLGIRFRQATAAVLV
ncbi:hypothetical protein BZA70DRAFT_275273 [Myxozyma melibiosi]|uniref:F-box domain-containing protein n=1 Tax=Myxozyma melibiosi TaxID=54550 RepID=A0ABR1FAK4_9ASCO